MLWRIMPWRTGVQNMEIPFGTRQSCTRIKPAAVGGDSMIRHSPPLKTKRAMIHLPLSET